MLQTPAEGIMPNNCSPNASEIAEKDLKDYNLKIKLCDRIVREYPDNEKSPKVLYQIAKIYEKEIGNIDKAVAVYQKVIDRYQGNSIVKSAQKRIKSLSK